MGGAMVYEQLRPTIITAPRPAMRDLLNGVNAASEAATTGWLLYVALGAYFIVALAGVTHKDLLLNTPISLPIFGISIRLDRFFLFAPPCFIALHCGVMMQHVILSRKVYAFLDAVKREESEMALQCGKPVVHPMRYELNGHFFTQFLAGPPNSPLIAFFMQTMVWGTLVMLAVIVLVYFQVAFLPFHDVCLIWMHRIYVLADLMIVAALGVFLPSPLSGFWPSFLYAWRIYPTFMFITVSAFALFFAFSWFVATAPDEWLDRKMASLGPSVSVPAHPGAQGGETPRQVFLPTAAIFEGAIDPATGESRSPLQRNLAVMDEDLVADKDMADGDVSLSLRYRDLRYARLDRSDLHQADLTCANLIGAGLQGTNLTGARLGCSGEDAPTTASQ